MFCPLGSKVSCLFFFFFYLCGCGIFFFFQKAWFPFLLWTSLSVLGCWFVNLIVSYAGRARYAIRAPHVAVVFSCFVQSKTTSGGDNQSLPSVRQAGRSKQLRWQPAWFHWSEPRLASSKHAAVGKMVARPVRNRIWERRFEVKPQESLAHNDLLKCTITFNRLK